MSELQDLFVFLISGPFRIIMFQDYVIITLIEHKIAMAASM